jgi:hypothetical protein
MASHDAASVIHPALLGGFKLPGEAQKISRILEVFAARYYTGNPEAGAYTRPLFGST